MNQIQGPSRYLDLVVLSAEHEWLFSRFVSFDFFLLSDQQIFNLRQRLRPAYRQSCHYDIRPLNVSIVHPIPILEAEGLWQLHPERVVCIRKLHKGVF